MTVPLWLLVKLAMLTVPERPLFHFTPRFGWTNDPNGLNYAANTKVRGWGVGVHDPNCDVMFWVARRCGSSRIATGHSTCASLVRVQCIPHAALPCFRRFRPLYRARRNFTETETDYSLYLTD